jgi:DNA-directed RNA polymerase subunit RPC12/RpoP
MGIGSWFKGLFENEEQIIEPMMNCSRCGFEYPEALLISDSGAKFCSECLDKKRKESADAEAKRKAAMANMKMKYYCYNCKFSFTRKRDFYVNACPNCGGGNFVPESKVL